MECQIVVLLSRAVVGRLRSASMSLNTSYVQVVPLRSKEDVNAYLAR